MIEIIKNSKGEDVYQDPVDQKWYKVRPEKIIKNSKQEDVTQVSNGDWHRVKGTINKPSAAMETVKALPKAFKAGSLETGRAMVKAYQNLGQPFQAPMPSVPPAPMTSLEQPLASSEVAPPTGPFAIQQKMAERQMATQTPAMQATRQTQLNKATEQKKAQDIIDTEKRFKSTQDIVNYYDKEIEGIKSKYKENLITKTAESLPLSLSALVTTMANPALGVAYTGYVFGGSSGQDLLDKAFAEERKKPENVKLTDAQLRAKVNDAYKVYAAISGAVQAGGEVAGNVLLSKIIPGTNPIKNKVLKGITSMLGGGLEEATTETGQEAGTILTEKAAKLDTTGAGQRLFDSFTVGGLSGILLGGLGGAAFKGETVNKVQEAVDNPTPETKAAAEEYIIKDWALAPDDSKQAFLQTLKPEQRKVFEASIAAEQERAAALAAENVQIKAEAAVDPEMQVRIAPKAEEYVKGWDGQKNDVVLGGVDISGLGSINALVKPELESYRLEAAKAFGVPENSSAYTIGTAMKKKAVDTAKLIFGNDAEVMVKGQGSDEMVIVSKRLSQEEMATKLAEFEKAMPTVEIPSAKKGAEMVRAGGVYTKVARGKNYSDFENAYSSALDIEKRAVVRDGQPAPEVTPPAAPTPPAETEEPEHIVDKLAKKFDEGAVGLSVKDVSGDKTIYYHGSVSGDLRGGATGLHLGTKKAAQEALESRIGIPASGKGWDGTQEYGKTLLAGKKTLRELSKKYPERYKYNETGFNMDVPENDFYPKEGYLKYADGSSVPLSVKPRVEAFRVKGKMTNSPFLPHDDFKANGYMAAQIKKGTAKSGYYYQNVGEDAGSISIVVPNGEHLERVNPGQYELYAGLPLNPFKIAMDLDKAWRGTKVFQTAEKALFKDGGKQNLPPEWWDLKAIQGIKPIAKALTPQYGISDQGKIAIDNYKAWMNENTDRIKTNIDKLKKLKPEEMRQFRKITESGEYVGKDDNLSKLAKETQDLSTDLYKQAVDLHLAGPSSFEGVYFPHIYKVLEGKKLDGLQKKTIAKVIKLQGQPDKLAKVNDMMATGKFTNDELGTLAKDFQAITKGGTTPNIIAGRTGVKIGPQHYAKQRQLADEQVMGLLQLIDDSPAPIAKRMVELTRDVGATRFLQEITNTPSEAIDASAISIAKEIKGKMGDKYQAGLPFEEYTKTDVNIPKERQANVMTYLSTGEFPDIPEGYSLVEGKKYGPLNGYAVNDNLLEQEIKPMVEAPARVDRILRKITSTYKFLKVPANLPTSARNLYTNAYSSWILGGVDPTDTGLMKRAITSIKNKDEHYKNMLKYDLVGSQWAAQELGQLETEITGGNPAEKVISKFGNVYSKSEEIFKAITYINAVEQGMEPRDAAYMASYALGNYGKIPPLIKQLRSGSAQGPLGVAGPIVQAPFLTWKYLFTGRFMTSLLRRPFSNLLIGATAYALFNGLKEGLKKAGKTDEEANRMIRDALKYWARHGKVVTPIPGVRTDKNGEIISDYLDLTFLSPFGDFAEFGTRLGEGNVQKAGMESIGMGGNPILNLMNLYRTGRNEFLNKDIYDKLDNPVQVQKKLFQEAFRQVAPSMLSYGVPNMINAIRGKTGGLGEKRSVGREVMSNLGIKTVPYQESLKQREAIRDIKDVQKDFMTRRWKLIKDGANQKEIDNLTNEFQKKVLEIKNR